MRRYLQGWPRGRSLAASLGIWMTTSTAMADFHEWSDTADVFINTSASGANIGTTFVGFPLLVRLEGNNFPFAEAMGKGQDIRFSNAQGKSLPYQIERWDSAAAKAEIWVYADTVKANSATHFLRMYWGHAGAADSSNANTTFPASKGFLSVFHMGGAGTRANAVPGGAGATPNNYDGDESRPGVIGLADSLDGGAPGDWLDLGAGYADLAGGFTYTAWVLPSAVKKWSHILDLGNPVGADLKGKDAICIGREDLTNNLITHLYLQNEVHSPLGTSAYFTNNAWQHITITIANADSTVRWYKNGALVDTKKMGAPLSTASRANNWMGRSPWTADEYFQGKLDEVRISKLPHSAAWIKLSYENQRIDQVLVTLKPPARCQASFAAQTDTTVNEGDVVSLNSRANCAATYDWAYVSGPALRIMDPLVKVLQFGAPRVSGDAVMVLRFSAGYGDSSRNRDVRVTIKEAIPEPAFTLPTALAWTSQDSLRIPATVTNLAAIKASRDSVLTWVWTMTGMEADSAWRTGALVLRDPLANGLGQVTLCLSNNSVPVCRSTEVTISKLGGVAVRAPVSLGRNARPEGPARSVDGRWTPAWSEIRKNFSVTSGR